MDRKTRLLALPFGALILSGCAGGLSLAGPTTSERTTGDAVTAHAAVAIEVYKSPSCDCCHEWEAYLRDQGFAVSSIPTEDMTALKDAHDVPSSAWSCHTAIIDGYVVEGHVPVAAIDDLLEAAPLIDGIALAGMPPGSPGMPGTQEEPFQVLAIRSGTTSPFGSY